MNEYYKKLYQEYNEDPEAFEKKTETIRKTNRELKRIMSKFSKEVDSFLKEK